MTFDPFGDFDERGYLRNKAGLHDQNAIKEFEHRAFLDKLESRSLRRPSSFHTKTSSKLTTSCSRKSIPGQDRTARLAPDIAVSKGETVLFAHPADAQRAVEYGLQLGSDPAVMKQRPGEVMGYLAYGHPFLDGNGRTIMVVHVVMAERAGISIDWSATTRATTWPLCQKRSMLI